MPFVLPLPSVKACMTAPPCQSAPQTGDKGHTPGPHPLPHSRRPRGAKPQKFSSTPTKSRLPFKCHTCSSYLLHSRMEITLSLRVIPGLVKMFPPSTWQRTHIYSGSAWPEAINATCWLWPSRQLWIFPLLTGEEIQQVGRANLAAPRCPAVIACKQQSLFDPIWPCSGEHLHLSLDHSISVGSRFLGNSLLVMSVSLCDVLLIVSVLSLTDQPGMSRYENLLVAVMDPVTHVWDYFYNTKMLPHIRFRTLGSSFVSIEQLCCLHPATTSERAKGRRGRAVPADLQFVSLVTKIQF